MPSTVLTKADAVEFKHKIDDVPEFLWESTATRAAKATMQDIYRNYTPVKYSPLERMINILTGKGFAEYHMVKREVT